MSSPIMGPTILDSGDHYHTTMLSSRRTRYAGLNENCGNPKREPLPLTAMLYTNVIGQFKAKAVGIV